MVKLQSVSIISVGRVFCGLHAIIGFLIALILTIGSISGQDEGVWAIGAWSLLIFPLVNAALGFLTGMFLGFCYNQLTLWFGGIEVEVEKDEAPHLSKMHG